MTARHDVSQMREVEEALRRSEAKYREIFEKIQDIFFRTNDQGLIVEVSPSVERYGYTREELIGMPAARAYEDPSKRITLLQLLEDGDITDREVRLRARDGRVVDFSISAHMLRGADGAPAGMEGCLRDISDRKRAEGALWESEAKYRRIFEGVQDIFYQIDTQAVITEISPSVERYGYKREEMIGRSVLEFYVEPEQSPALGKEILEQEEVADYEIRLKTSDGRVRDMSVSAHVYRDPDGTVIGKEGCLRDITDRKRAEDALRRSERELAIRNKIADVFLTVPDEEMYGAALQIILEALESRYGVFGCIDENGALVCPSLTRDVWDQSRVPGKDIVCSPEQWGGIWGRALTEKKSLYSNEPGRVPEGHIPILNSLAVPIIHRKRVIGLLCVANKETDYDENDQRLLETIAGHIAPILRARLQRDRQERRRRLAEEELRKHRDRLEELVGERTAELTQTNERLLREMEERWQAEEALRQSEERFSKAFHTAPVAIAINSVRDRQFIDVNQSFLELAGYSREEVIGRTSGELDLWADPNDRDLMLQTLLQERAIRDLESRVRRKSGDIRDTLTSFSMIEIHGEPCVLGMVRDITERKQAEEALRESEERFRTLYESSRDGIAAADLDGYITECNQAYAEMLGYSREELQGIRFQDITPSKWHALNADFARQVMEHDCSDEFEKEYIRKNGTVFPVSLRSWRINYEAGRPVGIWSIVRDITERKRAEQALRESERRFRQVLDVSSDMIYKLDLESDTFDYISPSVLEMMGFTREEFIAMGPRGLRRRIHPEDWQHYKRDLEEFLDPGSEAWRASRMEYRWQCKDGEYRWLADSRAIVRGDDGRPLAVVGAIRDTTERRQAEEALRDSEAKLKEAQALGRIGSWEFDVGSEEITWSDQTYQLYDRDPALGPPTNEEEATYYSQEQALKLREYARCAIEEGKDFEYDFGAELPSGRRVFYTATMHPIKDVNGRVVKLFGTAQDITERKQAEEALRESERRFLQVLDVSSDMIYKLDLESDTFDYISPSVLEMTGFTREEFIAMGPCGLRRRIHSEDWPDLRRGSEEFVELGSHPGFEYRLQYKDGEYRWLSDDRALIRGEDGRPLALVGTVRDVTERRRAEEALRDSEELFRTLSASAPIGIFLMDDKGNIIYANERLQAIGGPIPQGSRNIDFMAVVHPDDRERVLVGATRQQEGPAEDSQEFRILTPQGETRWVHLHARPILSADGRQSGVVGIVEDITERRQAEEALRESEQRFRQVLDVSSDMIYWLNLESKTYEYVSPSSLPLSGFTPKEFADLGIRGIRHRVHPDDWPQYKQEIDELLVHGARARAASQGEFCWRRKDGEFRWFSESRALVRGEDGRPLALVGTICDVTERRQAEEALRKSEERHRILFETIAQGIVYQAADGKIISANPAAERILGLTIDQMQGRTSIDPRWKAIHEDGSDFPGETHPSMVALKTGRKVLNVVMGVFNPKDDSHRWININAIPLFKPGENKPYQVYTTFEDITERQQAEEALRESEQRFRQVLDVSSDMIYKLDLESDTFDYVSPSALSLTGFTPQEVIDMGPGGVFHRVHPEDWQHYKWDLEEFPALSSEARRALRLEFRWQCKDGEYRWFADSRAIVRGDDGRLLAVVGTIRDTTERRQAEEALRREMETLKTTLDNIPVMVAIRDREGHHRLVNRCWQSTLGWSDQEASETDVLAEIYPDPEYRKYVVDFIASAVGTWGDFRTRVRDGRVLDTSWASVSLSDGSNIGIGIDVTERRQAEEALRESEERFRTLSASAPIGIFLTDAEGRTVYANEYLQAVSGLSPEESLGLRWLSSIHPDDREVVLAAKQKAADESAEFSSEFRLLTPQGATRWVRVRSKPMFSPEGKQTSRVGTLEDITERRQAEEQARQLHTEHVRANELRRMVRILEQMAATLGHELRNPLGVIGNSVYFLANQAQIDDPKAQKHVEIISHEVTSARRVIDDILEFAHVPQLLPAAAGINAVVDSALARSQIPANIRVVRKLAVDLPPLICDEERLERAFIDIITNAVQAMPHGGKLGVKTSRSGDDIEVVFSDSGEGIAPENLDKVFEPMFTTKLRGIGLGLTVVRRTVEQHGGGISVRSRLGWGAVFRITLPRDCRPLETSGGRVA